MASVYEIPLSPQAQVITATLANVAYQFTIQWNNQNNLWLIDIADQNGNPMVSGIPMVASTDLLEQYGYLTFGGALIAQTDNAPDEAPTFENLGTTGHLYFITPT